MHADVVKPQARPVMALLCGLLTGIALLVWATPASAGAAIDRSIRLSSQQWLMVDHMTHTTLFASLGINIVRGVDIVEEKRALFGRVLQGLRDGDAELGLEPPRSPEVLDRLAAVESLWLRYDATLQTILTQLRTAPAVDEAEILSLTDTHALLVAAIDDTTESLRQSRRRITTALRPADNRG